MTFFKPGVAFLILAFLSLGSKTKPNEKLVFIGRWSWKLPPFDTG